MRTLISLCVLALLAVSTQADGVLELNADNFDEVLSQHPVLLVEFYAPWCGHCKRLAPEYDEAAKELGTLSPPLFIAKVDADTEQNRPLAARFGIRGFPTLKLFRNGEVSSDFAGERNAAGIVSYMKKQASPAVREITTSDLSTISQADKVVVVGFFQDKTSEEYQAFARTGELMRTRYTFVFVLGDNEAAKQYESNVPGIVMFRQFDEPRITLTISDWNDLVNVIQANAVPTIDEIGPDNYKNYVDAGLPMVYLFLDGKDEEKKNALLAAVKPTAQRTKGQLSFIWIDWNKYAKHSERLGLSGQVVPAMAIDETQGHHFAFDESATITSEAVDTWVSAYQSKTLAPTIKSEEIPTNNDEPVKVAVAKNFQSLVIDNDKDVMVEFYAPWCGHCKKLTPIYDELARDLLNIPTLSLVKIDATANDVDGKYNVRGFPTLKFFPSGKKDTPVDYEGDRSAADMLSFIKQHATHTFEAPTLTPSSEKDEL